MVFHHLPSCGLTLQVTLGLPCSFLTLLSCSQVCVLRHLSDMGHGPENVSRAVKMYPTTLMNQPVHRLPVCCSVALKNCPWIARLLSAVATNLAENLKKPESNPLLNKQQM